MPQKRILAGVCAALIFLCFAIYGQTLFHAFVKCDDPMAVTGNYHVRAGLSWSNVIWAFTKDPNTYLMPVTWVSHMTDCDLYGLRPWGHHLTNLIFHTINAILLFLVFARVTRRLWPSALVALLFAVHPLHVEVVAWVAERKGLLGGLFWIATIGAYVWYKQRPNPARYLAVAVIFLMGLLSKPTVLALPFVLLLLDYWPLDRIDRNGPPGVMTRRAAWLAVEKIPLILLSAIFSVTTLILTAMRSRFLDFGEKVPLMARCANALVVYVLYLEKTLWPSGLTVAYAHPLSRPLWQVVGAAVILVAVTLFCLYQARRRPYLIVGWFWYLGSLVPVIGLVQSSCWSHADRYTYIPLTGIFAMVAWGAADWVEEWHVSKRAVAIASGFPLVLLTVCAIIQTGYWRDTKTLGDHELAVGQKIGVAYNMLGVLALEERRYDEANTWVTKALDLEPNDIGFINNMGMIALHQGHYNEAEDCMKKVLSVDPMYPSALNNMGLLAMDQGRYDEAGAWLAKALDGNPENVEALNNMGRLALCQQRYDEAKRWFKKALSLEPEYVSTLYNMGVLAMNQERYEEAKPWLAKAFEMDPENTDILNDLGLLAMDQRRYDEAKPWLAKALELNPGHVNALNNMGWCLMNQGQYEEAQNYFRKALEINPQFTKAMINLGDALAKLGRQEEARTYRKRAAELNQAPLVNK